MFYESYVKKIQVASMKISKGITCVMHFFEHVDCWL